MSTETTQSSENAVQMPVKGKLLVSSSPHVHNGTSTQKVMLTVIACLLPAALVGVYFFGFAAAKVLFFCIAFSVIAEIVWCKIVKKEQTWKDGSAALTGLLLAMNLNATTPWWICLIGSLFAIILVKQLFGGLGFNLFNPAIAARIALLIGFPTLMTTWVVPNQTPAYFQDKAACITMTDAETGPTNKEIKTDAATGATPLGAIKMALSTKKSTEKKIKELEKKVAAEQAPESKLAKKRLERLASEREKNKVAIAQIAALTSKQSYWDYFIGKVGGCLGETSALALLIGGLILAALKLIRWQLPAAYIGTVVVFTGIIHTFIPSQPDPLFHILTGGLIIGAFFMATDMVTSPMTVSGVIIFGIGCGIMTTVIRLFGNYPEGVSFSILFMNALVPLIDRYTRKKPFGYVPPVATATEGGK